MEGENIKINNAKGKYRHDVVGNTVKGWEEKTPPVIDREKWIVMRIDGHCFHTFTKPFDRPMDVELHSSMVNTMKDLCFEFNCITGYTQSDEITLVIPPRISETKELHIFNGKKQKLESLFASFTSARFNHYLGESVTQDMKAEKKQAMISGCAFFDARAISLDNLSQVVDVVKWRFEYDCFRNGISSLAHSVFASKQLFKKTTKDKINMLKEAGVDINNAPYRPLLYGKFMKKSMVWRDAFNPKTQQTIPCFRSVWCDVTVAPGEFNNGKFADFVSTPFIETDKWKDYVCLSMAEMIVSSLK